MGGVALLKSFLIALGFRVDAASMQRFNTAVASSERGVRGLGRSAIWASTAVIGAVALMARSLDKLYFTSLRTGDTAENIEAFAFGMQRAGISTEHARAMLEGFSMELRRNPGKMALLEALGVHAKGAQAQLNGLVSVLSKMPFYVGAMYAEQFGVSPDDLLIMQKTMATRAQAEKEMRSFARDADINLTDATKAANDFSNAIAGIGEKFRLISAAFVQTMAPWLTEQLKNVNDALASAGRLLAEIRQNPGDKNPKPGEAGYIPGMRQGDWMDPLRIFGYGLMEAERQNPGYLFRSGQALGSVVDEAKDRTAWPAQPPPAVNVTIHTSDPSTTVDVNGRNVTDNPLGPSAARNLSAPTQ